MKTRYEVESHIHRSRWYHKWLENLKKESSTQMVMYYDTGQMGILSISTAFEWKMTPEGRDFWLDIHQKFLKWYNNETKKQNEIL